MNKPPEQCPKCQSDKDHSIGSMDGAVHITYECGSKWHGWPDGVSDGFQKYPNCDAIRMSNEMRDAIAPDTLVEVDEDKEKVKAIAAVLKILEDDFDGGDCGKHGTIVLSCYSCQAAIVRAWLEDTSDLCYGPED